MFWRRSSAIRVAPALTLTAALSVVAFGGAPASAQTLGDLIGAAPRAQAAIPGPDPAPPPGTSLGPSFDPPPAGTDTPRLSTRAPGRALGTGLFGTTEIMSGSLKGLPQWTRVLGEMENERAAFAACARDAGHCGTPTLRNWSRIIREAAPLDRAGKIRAVNTFFNQWPYKEDREIYGRSEYWASPQEFMARSGDCEDYSIAKYFALRALGFDKQDMRIVILMDEIRGIGHAVLAVYEKDGIVILDSLSNLIMTHDRYKHYRPQYSMNETTRWAHLGGYDDAPAAPYKGLIARRDQNGVWQ